jgi:hypothetical protein
VAVSNGVVVIGALYDDDGGSDSGSAYLYEQDAGGIWIETAKLTPSDAAANDLFGGSVAVSNGVVVVGAFGDDDYGLNSGSAYIFEPDAGGNWIKTKLVASDAAAADTFGISVAVSNGVAVVGAWGGDDGGSDSGSAYIFEQDAGGIWTEKAKLTASDAAAGDYFGYSVAVSNGVVVVGALGDDDGGADSGLAYLYEQDAGGIWIETAKLTASDPAQDNNFGKAVAVSNGVVVVGTHYNDDGAAYIFDNPVCAVAQVDLETCNTELASVEDNLAVTKVNIETCNMELASVEDNLATKKKDPVRQNHGGAAAAEEEEWVRF